jgi:PAS domain S-box-containing protein
LKPGGDNDLKIPEQTKANLYTLLECGGDGESSSVDELRQVLDSAQRDIIQVMAIGAWPRFLMSESFAEWQRESRDRGHGGSQDDNTHDSNSSLDAKEGKEGANGNDPHHITLEEKMTLEFSNILTDQSWLASLLLTVESLPLCVSVASANKTTRGFPLIYVNSFFEQTTGYSRAEILGQNCRFLQNGREPGQVAEATSIARMSDALAYGRSVKVAITNFRKDGSSFMNLLAMKPIFDHEGNYAFVVGIQFDIGENYAAPERLKMVEDLLRALPDKIFTTGYSHTHTTASLA